MGGGGKGDEDIELEFSNLALGRVRALLVVLVMECLQQFTWKYLKHRRC